MSSWPRPDARWKAQGTRNLSPSPSPCSSRHDRRAVSAFAVENVLVLGRRSVVRTLRQPANVVFPIIFPLLLLAVNAGGLDAATRLPGFPTDSYLAFALAIPFIQGALFATMNAGTDLARDIQTGFLNRLSL